MLDLREYLVDDSLTCHEVLRWKYDDLVPLFDEPIGQVFDLRDTIEGISEKFEPVYFFT